MLLTIVFQSHLCTFKIFFSYLKNKAFQTSCLQLGQGALYYFLASPQIVFNSDKLVVQV